MIDESKSVSLNTGMCHKQAASSKEASLAFLCWFFVFSSLGFFSKTVNSALVIGLQMQATMHSRDSMCTIIPHFMDKAQKAAEIFQVEENSSSQINKSESIIINNILIQGFTRVQLS